MNALAHIVKIAAAAFVVVAAVTAALCNLHEPGIAIIWGLAAYVAYGTLYAPAMQIYIRARRIKRKGRQSALK